MKTAGRKIVGRAGQPVGCNLLRRLRNSSVVSGDSKSALVGTGYKSGAVLTAARLPIKKISLYAAQLCGVGREQNIGSARRPVPLALVRRICAGKFSNKIFPIRTRAGKRQLAPPEARTSN